MTKSETQTNKVTVQKREALGHRVKKLRREGWVPANIFGNHLDSLSIQLKLAFFKRLFREAGETEVIDITVEGEKLTRPVMVRNVQFDPVTAEPLHVDFFQVDLTEKVTVAVPLRFSGESPAVKAGNLLLELLEEIEVEALPREIPEEIVIDVSKLTEVNQTITLTDLSLPLGIEVTSEPTTLICKIEAPAVEEEVVPPVPAAETEAQTTPAGTESHPAEEKATAEEKEEK